MDILDQIIKYQMIFSYENNLNFRNQLVNTFQNHYTQNIKYHLMWIFLHSFSFAYPDVPSDEYKIETANFIANIIPKNLGGCSGCQNDYKTYIETLNIFKIVSSKQEISSFFVNLHNFINNNKFEKKYYTLNTHDKIIILTNGKDKLSTPVFVNYDDVKKYYETTDFISLLEARFNINMFSLIHHELLSSFYDDFNKINFNSNVFNIDIAIT